MNFVTCSNCYHEIQVGQTVFEYFNSFYCDKDCLLKSVTKGKYEETILIEEMCDLKE